MKEKLDARTDPVLEECYRMKEAFAAKFNSTQELYDYLVAETKKNKALGWNIYHLHHPELKKIQVKKKPDRYPNRFILLALIFKIWYSVRRNKGKLIVYGTSRTNIS